MSFSQSLKSIFYVDLEDGQAAEVIEEGYAIYSIKPKKIHLSATNSLTRQFLGVGGSSRKARLLMAGSLEAIVEGLAPQEDTEDKLDCLHMNILLTTYPAFTTTQELLDVVFDKLQHGSSRVNTDRLRAALLVTLNAWLGEPYQEHFRRPPEFADLRRLAELCERAAATAATAASSASPTTGAAGEVDVAGRLDLLGRLARRRLETFGAAAAAAAATEAGREFWRRLEWEEMDDLQVAEQLTRMDAHLFEALLPHECLGSQWGRHKRTGCSPTVDATVRQFNRVCAAVATLTLRPTDLSVEQRAGRLLRWIRVAQYLRERRSFSSLCAIVCTLNLECVRRLTRVWRRVPTSARELLAELALLADARNNFQGPRDVVNAEGTGKTLSRQLSVPNGGGGGGSGGHHTRVASNLSQSEQSSGTIPYLGTSLTDLEGLHTAFPDRDRGLINFDKRRREYDVLARLRLYQVTCRQYQYCEDARFEYWFNNLDLLTEEEQLQRSLDIQPERRVTPLWRLRRSRRSSRRTCTWCTFGWTCPLDTLLLPQSAPPRSTRASWSARATRRPR